MVVGNSNNHLRTGTSVYLKYADKEIATSKFKIREAYWTACKKKGRHIGGGAPEGAYY